MFKGITLRGKTGSIVWAYRPAAALTTWTITSQRETYENTSGTLSLKPSPGYTLTATLGPHVDRFQLRQRPLLFTAPRTGGLGFWCWPVQTLTVGERTLLASLGPPEY